MSEKKRIPYIAGKKLIEATAKYRSKWEFRKKNQT